MPEEKMKWINFLTDNGLPIPLIRHRGRGDLIATLAVGLCLVIGIVLLIGGSSYESEGIKIVIPKIEGFSHALAAIVPSVGIIYGYIVKRAQDKATNSIP